MKMVHLELIVERRSPSCRVMRLGWGDAGDEIVGMCLAYNFKFDII